MLDWWCFRQSRVIRAVIRIAFFVVILLGVVAVSFWRGRRDEQIASLVCVAGSVLTALSTQAAQIRFSYFNMPAFIIDVSVLFAFLVIALRSSRFWPLWVAGLQLSATTVHLMILADPEVVGKAFGAALAFWSYPILLLIGIGAWRTAAVERWRSGSIAWPGEIT